MNKPAPAQESDPVLEKMREPFPAHQISKLPKETKKQREEREADRSKGINCQVCGGWHHRNAVHLDYVGHAALTDRLLDADPFWSWEPAAFRDGLPAFDQTGGLWIRLTIGGVTRLGYGHAAAKPQMDPGAREKEVIGDALRNAAMRFGAALDLWHKGDLHVAEAEAEDATVSGAVAAATVAIGLCKTEAALTKWSAQNAEMITKLDPADKTEVRRLYGLRLEALRKASSEEADRLANEHGAAPHTAADPFSEAA